MPVRRRGARARRAHEGERVAGRAPAIAAGVRTQPPGDRPAAIRAVTEAVRLARTASCVHLLLDYDGTLVPLAPTPAQAPADAGLIRLVDRLASRPGLDVHVVSGRDRVDLLAWFGDLDVSLWAEHGFWHRGRAARRWRALGNVDRTWMDEMRPVLASAAKRLPGAWVEEKAVSLVWHYRQSPPELAARAVERLKARLRPSLGPLGLEALDGHQVVEVRAAGVGKATVARWLARHGANRDAVVALGDDRTDDELFAALPGEAVTISVGQALAHARFQLPDPRAVRRFLESFLRAAPTSSRPS